MENLRQQLEILPANLSNHLMITVIPLGLGICLSLLLAMLVVRRPTLRYPALTAVSVIQTIPSFALLALMVPVLAGFGVVTAMTLGFEVSALGFYPTVIALTLYSILPVLRNTVTGILGVDPSVVEAARGVGMTPRQVLWKVELPLALPVMIAGIRTATVWVVGIATLATPVGQRCLGNYIFRGLQTRNWTAVLVGCLAAVVLAILLDLLIGGLEKSVEKRRRGLGILCAAVLAAVFLGGGFAPAAVRAIQRSDTAVGQATVRIGTKTFTEQYILSSVIADLLEQAGFRTNERESLGSTVVFDALSNNEIDCYVDYTGTIWTNYMDQKKQPDADRVMNEVREWLKEQHGIHCLGALGFENAYGLAMARNQAEKLGATAIGNLAPHAPGMKIGGDYEFFGRPEWRAIKNAYGLDFADQASYDSTFLYKAVREGNADVISAFTSDGRIAAYDLVILDDPKNTIPPYDAVLLLGSEAAKNEDLVDALRPLVGSIRVETMRRANYMVDREKDKKTIDESARWLRKQILPVDAPPATTTTSTAQTSDGHVR